MGLGPLGHINSNRDVQPASHPTISGQDAGDGSGLSLLLMEIGSSPEVSVCIRYVDTPRYGANMKRVTSAPQHPVPCHIHFETKA